MTLFPADEYLIFHVVQFWGFWMQFSITGNRSQGTNNGKGESKVHIGWGKLKRATFSLSLSLSFSLSRERYLSELIFSTIARSHSDWSPTVSKRQNMNWRCKIAHFGRPFPPSMGSRHLCIPLVRFRRKIIRKYVCFQVQTGHNHHTTGSPVARSVLGNGCTFCNRSTGSLLND